ncbi:hypothetical protein RJ639_032423 [Escallonia herrerae]|uniref:Uncharacterized protein n=1 Tax=Escallonia herrerae TaxID=1293975 RepID=A0AA88X7J9_9ASTE|nr:hypothetical protein RJ639_032423 [Escallonia herrerae]
MTSNSQDFEIGSEEKSGSSGLNNWGIFRLEESSTARTSGAKASTSESARTLLVEEGRFRVEFGIKAHVSNSSPQKSPGPRVMELKNPDLPPLVVELSSCPLIINSISSVGSPSRTIKATFTKGKHDLEVKLLTVHVNHFVRPLQRHKEVDNNIAQASELIHVVNREENDL